jgi:Arc/MetJ family transcription regulator
MRTTIDVNEDLINDVMKKAGVMFYTFKKDQI